MSDLSNFLRLLVWWLPNRKYQPVPGSQQNITHGEHIRLQCPKCNAPMDATENIIERRSVRTGRWQTFYRAYECDTCYSLFNIDSCADDGTGLFHVSPWNCPLCQHSNDPLSRQCAECGAGDNSTD